MVFLKQVRIVICGLLLFVICWGLYFASQISATYPPIKNYEIDLTLDEFEVRLSKILSDNDGICLVNKDTTGTKENGYRYYLDFKKSSDTSNYTYYLAYEIHHKAFKNRPSITMDLIGAFNLLKNTGGYKPNSEGVQVSLESFEKEILILLDPSQKL